MPDPTGLGQPFDPDLTINVGDLDEALAQRSGQHEYHRLPPTDKRSLCRVCLGEWDDPIHQPQSGQARFVRIYGTRARTEREGFQIITRMPPPPTDDPNDPEPYEGWLTLVHDEIERRKPKGWTVEKWDVDVDWMSHVD